MSCCVAGVGVKHARQLECRCRHGAVDVARQFSFSDDCGILKLVSILYPWRGRRATMDLGRRATMDLGGAAGRTSPEAVGNKRDAQSIAPPPVLVTAVPQLQSSRHHLASVEPEAREVQAAFGGVDRATLRLNISAEELDPALNGREVWCFAGHGDAPLGGENVPAFVSDDGQLQSISITTLAEIVRRHTPPHGDLRLVVFTGCCVSMLGIDPGLFDAPRRKFVPCSQVHRSRALAWTDVRPRTCTAGAGMRALCRVLAHGVA